MDNQIKKQIFLAELNALKYAGLISDENFRHVNQAYAGFSNKREIAEQEYLKQQTQLSQAAQLNTEQRTSQTTPQSMQALQNEPQIPYTLQRREETSLPNNIPQSAYNGTVPQQRIATQPPVTGKPASSITPAETRDRNITLLLILGTILILLSGVIFATTNWQFMNNISRVTLIFLATLFFFGVSFIMEKYLKIKKSSFAFWILGCFFLPISVLSIGYFQLFGTWLSLFGEGCYLLGYFGTLICLPVYFYSAYKYKTKVYPLIFMVTLSISVAFLIAAFYPSRDVFILCIVLYNAALVFGGKKIRKIKDLDFITGHLLEFTQINMIISTVIMLVFFNSLKFYGINIILMSLIYLSVLYLEELRGYIFVFTPLLFYGIFQALTHSVLKDFSTPVLALACGIFVVLENIKITDDRLKKLLPYINGAVSLIIFIYVGSQSIFMSYLNTPSVSLYIALIILSVNYLYLNLRTKNVVFAFIGMAFLITCANQEYQLLHKYFGFNYHVEYLFANGVLMFVVLYLINKAERFRQIRIGGAFVSILTMLGCVLYTTVNNAWTISYIIFFVLAICCYLVNRLESSYVIGAISRAAIPVFTFSGLFITHYDLHLFSKEYHFGVTVLVMFLISLILRRFEKKLEPFFFWTIQILMPCAAAVLSVRFYDNPVIFFIPAIIYAYSIFRLKREWSNYLFLYLSFISLTLGISSAIKLVRIKEYWINAPYYPIVLASAIIGVLWLVSKQEWRSRIIRFLIPYTLMGVLIINYSANYGFTDTVITISALALILIMIHIEKFTYVQPIVLLIVQQCVYSFFMHVLGWKSGYAPAAIISLAAFIILNLIGQILYKKVVIKEDKRYIIDWYSIMSFGYLIFGLVYTSLDALLPAISDILPYLLIPCFLYFQVRRVSGSNSSQIIKVLTILCSLLPYYKAITILNIPDIIETEAFLLPWVAATIILRKTVLREHEHIIRRIETVVLIITAFILFIDVFRLDYLTDALIVEGLSLISIIWGVYSRSKSYLLIGAGSILLVVIVQTWEFWSNMPWWGYLLVVGTVLIVMAVANEIKKNQPDVGIKSIISRFKSWN